MAENLSINIIAKALGIKSLVDLKAGFDMVFGTIGKLKDGIENLTAEYGVQEKANAQLSAVLKSTKNAVGLTKNEIQNMAAELQNITGIGDEVVQGGQNLLLTFTNIGKDVFPEATKTMLDMSTALGQDLKSSAIQLGKALQDPIQGVTALRRVGVNFNETQMETIRSLVESGNQMEAQKMILRELNTEFGGSAKAIGDTFGGSLMKLNSAQGDMREGFGKIIAVIGKDFVESMTKGTKAITEFISDSDKVATIGASFKVLQEVGKDLAGAVWQQAKKTFKEIKDKLGEIIPAGKESSVIFTALASAGKLMSMAFNVGIKIIGILITAFIDTVTVVKNAIEVLKSFWDAATGKAKWKDAWEAVKNLGGAYTDVYKNIAASTKDLVAVTVDEFKKLPDNVASSAKDLQKVFEKTYGEYKSQLENDIVEPTAAAGEELKSINADLLKEFENFYKSDKQKAIESVKEKTQTFIDGGIDVVKAKQWEKEQLEKIESDFQDESAPKWSDWAKNITGIILDSIELIQSAFNQMYENQLAMLDEYKEAQLEAVQDWIDQEMEKQGVKEESESERLDRMLAEKRAELAAETDAEKRKILEDQIRDLEKEKKRAEIKQQAEDKINKIEEEARKKELEIKKKQFNANKALQIAQIWINAAGAVMGWWSSFASMGIPGIALAAVMTAATLITAGIQTGLVASQQFHGEKGGRIPGNFLSGDKINVGTNSLERILTPQQNRAFEEMAFSGSSSGGANFYIENLNVYANDAERIKEQLLEMSRKETYR